MGDSKVFKAMFGDAAEQYGDIGDLFDDNPAQDISKQNTSDGQSDGQSGEQPGERPNKQMDSQ